MLRLAKSILVLGFAVGFFTAVAFGFIFILSGGDPLGYLQTTYLKIQLAAREDELAASAGDDATEQRFTIASGQAPVHIAQNLYNQGLITDAQLFINYLIVEDIDRSLEAGTYFLNQTQTIPEIAYTLIDSRNSSIPFRVIEGSRLEEIAESIDSNTRFAFTGDDFLAVVGTGAALDPEISERYGIPAGASLEGFMYPDSYILSPNITPEGLRDTLIGRFSEVITDQMISDAQAQSLSIHDAVILASIVEREAVYSDENPMIASVYRNRLNEGMRLDADPTVQYAINGTRGLWWTNITQADYRAVESPYNTYLNYGLPPGPIANPSLSAIEAAIYPAESEFLFFRAKCDNSHYHVFTTSYEEHLANAC